MARRADRSHRTRVLHRDQRVGGSPLSTARQTADRSSVADIAARRRSHLRHRGQHRRRSRGDFRSSRVAGVRRRRVPARVAVPRVRRAPESPRRRQPSSRGDRIARRGDVRRGRQRPRDPLERCARAGRRVSARPGARISRPAGGTCAGEHRAAAGDRRSDGKPERAEGRRLAAGGRRRADCGTTRARAPRPNARSSETSGGSRWRPTVRTTDGGSGICAARSSTSRADGAR